MQQTKIALVFPREILKVVVFKIQLKIFLKQFHVKQEQGKEFNTKSPFDDHL